MSLVEAAAALDQLLQGQSEESLPLNAFPHFPPLISPSDADTLPTLFSNVQLSEVKQSCTSTESITPTVILPWKNLPSCGVEETPCASLCQTISSLSSPQPIHSPALPHSSPLSGFEWTCSQPRESIDNNGTASMTTDDCPKWRKRRRRNAYSESADTCGNFTPLDPQKYKTELCRSFQVHGNCRYGVRCNYAHGLQELRGATRHGKYKTRNCKSYHQTGFCRYGARCSFIHDPEEGVLKCSIANKEVLEALHYNPGSEECPRVANITWRFLESSDDNVPELHFINTSTPSQEHHSMHRCSDSLEEILCASSSLQQQINLLLSARDIDEKSFISCTFPLYGETTSQSSSLLLQENLELLQSLQKCEEYSKIESFMMTRSDRRATYPLLNNGLLVKGKEESESCPDFECRLPLENSDFSALPTSVIEPATVREIDSEDELVDENSSVSLEGKMTGNTFCQKVKDLDIVQAILQNAPVQSSLAWSDGVDGQQADLEDSTPRLPSQQDGNDKDRHKHQPEAKRKPSLQDKGGLSKPRQRMRYSYCKNRRGRRFNKADFGARFCEENTSASKDIVLRSESDGSGGDLEVSTNAAGINEDSWSERSSFNLADLLRSLRLREGGSHLLPRAKSGRRYSSDGSSVGPLSPKEPCSSPSSPASPRQHDMSKYKTELCRSFQYNGCCSYGDACLCAHGQVDLRSYPKHPMYRTKQCFSFHNKGFCLYGSRCQFLHDIE